MRHSPLLHTSLSSFLMALIAVGAFGWACLIAVHAALNLAPAEVLALVKSAEIPSVLAAGITTGVVAFLGPRVIRFVLAKRGLVFLAVASLALVDPLLALATVLLIFLAFGLIRAFHRGAGSTITQVFDFSDISWPWKVLFAIGGALIVLGIATMPRLSWILSSFLPWPVFSIYGILTVAGASVILGFVVGNFYFPKIIGSTWAMLAFFSVMLIINPVVGGISTVYGLILMLVESKQSDRVHYVGDNNYDCDDDWVDPFHPLLQKNDYAGQMIERSLTPCTPESEASGIYRNNNHIGL